MIGPYDNGATLNCIKGENIVHKFILQTYISKRKVKYRKEEAEVEEEEGELKIMADKKFQIPPRTTLKVKAK